MITVGDTVAGYTITNMNVTGDQGAQLCALLGVKHADRETPAEYVVWTYEPHHSQEPYNGRYSGTMGRAMTNYLGRIVTHAERVTGNDMGYLLPH